MKHLCECRLKPTKTKPALFCKAARASWNAMRRALRNGNPMLFRAQERDYKRHLALVTR